MCVRTVQANGHIESFLMLKKNLVTHLFRKKAAKAESVSPQSIHSPMSKITTWDWTWTCEIKQTWRTACNITMYPVVNQQFAIENGHRNSWFTIENGDYPSFFVMFTRGWIHAGHSEDAHVRSAAFRRKCDCTLWQSNLAGKPWKSHSKSHWTTIFSFQMLFLQKNKNYSAL